MAKRLDPVAETIRTNMVRFREEAELSQAKAALASGIPLDNLRRYENGTSGVDALVLKQLADAYGHQVDDFYKPKPPPANLEDRPVFFLRTLPGVEVDDEIYQELVDHITQANKRHYQTVKKRRPAK